MDHITSDLDQLTMREKYHCKEQVQVANGLGLSITHVGQSCISTPARKLNLSNVLHVPKVSKNLLLVHRLTNGNNVFFEFHLDHFVVKDRVMRSTLLRGTCECGLYPIPLVDAVFSKEALLSFKASQEQWHDRFGHPSSSTVHQIIQSSSISCLSNKSLQTVCNACQMVKSHQFPIPVSNNVSSFLWNLFIRMCGD